MAKEPWIITSLMTGSPRWAWFMATVIILTAREDLKGAAGEPSECFEERQSPYLEKFVDELPIPDVVNVGRGVPETLGAYKINQKLHRDLKSTTLYGFGTSQATAQYPGPTLEARRWVETQVTWQNHIQDSKHFLPVDNTIAAPNLSRGGVPIVVHLHGAEAPSSSDGHPEAWFTFYGETGETFSGNSSRYPNHQPPSTLWYHDHTIGITRLNVAAGLFGLYVLRSPDDESGLQLPRDRFELPLIFQDKRFFDNGEISVPSVGSNPSVHPAWCPDSLGDTMLVNGKVSPFLNVSPSKYRFRMLNANTDRFLLLSLQSSNGSTALEFCQIGTDGGYLPQPQYLRSILMAPGERADVIIDCTSLAPGSEVLLINSARAPFPGGIGGPGNTGEMLKLVVIGDEENSTYNDQTIPSLLRNAVAMPIQGATVRRHTLTNVYSGTSSAPVQFLLNYLRFKDTATETPSGGSTEIWEFINLTENAHAIHIHLVSFQCLNLQSFDVAEYTNGTCSLEMDYPDAGSCYMEYPRSPLPFLIGWKDTVTVWPGNVTRIAIRFTSQEGSAFPFDATAAPGYVWECHLLGHEDNSMMRPLILK